jgi:signal peptidase II
VELLYEPKHLKSDMERMRVFLRTALLVFVIDQITKALIISTMDIHESIPLINGFFHLTFILNFGASFGILQQHTVLLTIVPAIIIFAIFWIVHRGENLSNKARNCLGLIVGGAIGNLADRLQYGAVVDFLDFRGIWAYIFNVGDTAVVIGGCLLGLLILCDEWSNEKDEPRH